MISVTRLDGREMVVNSDHILTVEHTPDTVLTLTTGARVLVKESVEEIVERTVVFRRRIGAGARVLRLAPPPENVEA